MINNVSEEGAGFGTETNKVTYLDKNLKEYPFPLDSKEAISEKIYHQIIKTLEDDNQ